MVGEKHWLIFGMYHRILVWKLTVHTDILENRRLVLLLRFLIRKKEWGQTTCTAVKRMSKKDAVHLAGSCEWFVGILMELKRLWLGKRIWQRKTKPFAISWVRIQPICQHFAPTCSFSHTFVLQKKKKKKTLQLACTTILASSNRLESLTCEHRSVQHAKVQWTFGGS